MSEEKKKRTIRYKKPGSSVWLYIVVFSEKDAEEMIIYLEELGYEVEA